MLFDMGFLALDFDRLARVKDPKRVPSGLLEELGVVLATQGFGLNHWAWAFGWAWPRHMAWATEVKNLGDMDLADLNARSITLDDGLAWLRALLVIRPAYGGSVPQWTQMALRQSRITAAELGVRPGVLSQWRGNTRFDPLMGGIA